MTTIEHQNNQWDARVIYQNSIQEAFQSTIQESSLDSDYQATTENRVCEMTEELVNIDVSSYLTESATAENIRAISASSSDIAELQQMAIAVLEGRATNEELIEVIERIAEKCVAGQATTEEASQFFQIACALRNCESTKYSCFRSENAAYGNLWYTCLSAFTAYNLWHPEDGASSDVVSTSLLETETTIEESAQEDLVNQLLEEFIFYENAVHESTVAEDDTTQESPTDSLQNSINPADILEEDITLQADEDELPENNQAI